uniref:Saposin B-type domain-containing protein n=1 Tax=Plectus sambesii TaxID=2011161 RepID=A0A914WJH4_9BILA
MKTFFVAVIAALALTGQMVSAGGLFCGYCDSLVGAGITYCEGAKTETQVEQLLNKYCDEVVGSSSVGKMVCNLLVDEGVQYIWKVIQKGGTPSDEAQAVCQCIDLCSGDCSL